MLRKLKSYAWIGAVTASSRAKRMLMGQHVEALLVNTPNGLFLVDVEDQVVGRRLAYHGDYAPDELARLTNGLTEKSTVLVVGTHIGSHAIAISRHCASLTAIEANPKTFKLLQMNLLINGCTNVNAINIAASDKKEEIQFVMNRANSGGSKRAPVVKEFAYYYDSPEVVSVPAVPLDELLAGQRFDTIVMDIEGSEYFALKGMPAILASAKVLFVEFIPHHLRNVSCVNVAEFVATLSPYFSKLYIPSKQRQVEREAFVPELQAMFDRDESDDGLQFSK